MSHYTVRWSSGPAFWGCSTASIQTAALMKASTGNDKMREIAAAIQEGASAYLRRQYTTIAIVGVVVLIAAYLLIGAYAAIGFLIGAVLSGARRLHRHASRCAPTSAPRRRRSESLAKGLELAFKAGAITGMLVAGGALLGVSGYYAYLTCRPSALLPSSREVIDGWSRWASAPR
jgi:K(+)-stimulated pyrophosphate-energized sodium pump